MTARKKRRAHFFRAIDGACVDGKPPATKQIRERCSEFARHITRLEFGARRGNRASVSRLRFRAQHERYDRRRR
jgi:hypothetical protein